ncbi:uncharacterized protein C2845_PM18G10490 [Panicum miliaceum]|uniref:KIB1-4 beta-propeller domain-containing protein n=1 Tax=Panicum miliaceum TaxID=4540 RepID=A0A3L6PKV5_PANMI|nr:uncharacterized protein C2845_PM18G10490 [Panicum miliaceum]
MDSRKATSGDPNRHAPLPDRVSKGVKPSRSLAAVAKTRCSTECATASEAPSSDESQRRAWADLPSDILGVMIGRRGRLAASAASVIKSEAKLALWRSGMKSWCVCDGGCITKFIDIIFCQEKLYMLSISESTANLFAFEISDDDDCLMVSRAECREIEWPVVMDSYREMWSIVEWLGKLLIVATYSHDAEFWQQITDVRVFEADLSTNPVRLTEIESLDGDCICLSPCSSKRFVPINPDCNES